MAPQQRDPAVFFLLRSSWLEGSGRLSRGTRCITAVLPVGSPRAESVTFPCRNRPWYINRSISALETWNRQNRHVLSSHMHPKMCNSPPPPPTLPASCRRQTGLCPLHSRSDWTGTLWSCHSPKSTVNLSVQENLYRQCLSVTRNSLCPQEHSLSPEQASL